MLIREANTPWGLWRKLNLAFISEGGDAHVDENTGISVQSFHNRFTVLNWDPDSAEGPLRVLMRRMGYSDGGTKITQLTNKYLDTIQMEKMKVALKEYRDKKRFTLGMTFKNSPARSGGCLTGLQIVKYKNTEEAIIYAKIVEVPKKFCADLYFFNGLLRDLLFHGTVHMVVSCMFFWKVTSPLLVPIFGLERFEHPSFRAHVIKKIKDRARLAGGTYAYKNEERTWLYLCPIIDQMIKEGRLSDYEEEVKENLRK